MLPSQSFIRKTQAIYSADVAFELFGKSWLSFSEIANVLPVPESLLL